MIFKAKTKYGEWVLGYHIKTNDSIGIGIKFDTNDEILMHTICEYTGFDDSEENKIFKYDLLWYKDVDIPDDEKLLKVTQENIFSDWIVVNNDGIKENLSDLLKRREMIVVKNFFDTIRPYIPPEILFPKDLFR